MIGVDEALDRVLSKARARGVLPVEIVPIDDAVGRILRETVRADRDFPPFTRSAMDGYALRSGDARDAPVTLAVVEEIPAGRQPTRAVGRGEASRIMTGAPIPDGADAVCMVEKTRPAPEKGLVSILEPVGEGDHIRRAGEDLKQGEMLIEAGVRLDGTTIGLLATAGRSKVEVSRRPLVSILPTGDELVPIDTHPGAAQIRESNGRSLDALVRASGAAPRLRPIVPDRPDALKEAIGEALRASDVVLLSGGVSMGEFDLVGEALTDLGCAPIFDRVAIQPGKPLWFGTGPGPSSPLIFGLPGNPVSTIVDFLVFAAPALGVLAGSRRPVAPTIPARLTETLRRRPGRRAYLPAILLTDGDDLTVSLVPSMGSADLVALSRANALAIVPEDREAVPAGSLIRVLPLNP